MLIKKLILQDFRQYIGRQEIEFSTDPEKNVTVLIGMNTSGKTTFIRAFEWIMYGKNDFDIKELLNQNIVDNMHVGDTKEVMGTIVLEHGGKEFEITRCQLYTCIGDKKVRASLSKANIMYLQPDGQTKTEISSDFDSNIERILPRALSNYFFFGGERIGAISSREDIESSVKGLMGLDVLYNAMIHLKAIISRLKKSMDFSGDQQAIRIRDQLDGTMIKLQEFEKEQATLAEQLDYYRSEKEKYAALLKANEETAADQNRREQLDAVIASLEQRITKDKKEMVSAFSRNGFAYFSMPLLEHTVKILDKASEETESVPEMSAPAIDYILKRGFCICGTRISKDSMAERCLLSEKAKQPPESIGALVRRYREQAMDYLSSSSNYYEAVKEKFADIRAEQREFGFRSDERIALDEKLKGAKNVSNLEAEYRKAENRIGELEREQSKFSESIGACKKDIGNFERALESYGKANQKNVKISLNIAYAQAALDWVAEAYHIRESVVRCKLEEKVNANFALMYHGSRKIMIDDKYHVKYIDVTTEESDGLKAVKSFAFVSGLVDLAKEALSSDTSSEANIGPQYYPLVMDAPFSNVDETHIKNISKILPKSAEQVIIAVMQKDWEPAAPIMQPVIGRSYAIIKDKDADGKYIDTLTHIKQGG